ncbi:hypothetical protein H0H93_008367 [Arthromyces matolae]|nr:hypothetical protein H0H93_008367 [Arthromyces matolae]
MPLFDVPGWTVEAPAIAEASAKTSKKRKRSAVEPHNLKAAEANFEKLIKQLEHSSSSGNSVKAPEKTKTIKKKKTEAIPQDVKSKKGKDKQTKKHVANHPQPAPPKTQKELNPPSTPPKKAKKKLDTPSTSASNGLTALQKGMKESLDVLSEYPQGTVIADLGCGDAALARSLTPKGLSVISLDLVSDGVFVVEADICDKIPLPGSGASQDDKSEGEGHIVDVVVCALSLMGTNWPNCIREAWRILKPSGELKIAEVASRFTNVTEFRNLVESIGFRLKSKDDSNSHFTLFEFKKIAVKGKSQDEWEEALTKARLLKPCEYKRR